MDITQKFNKLFFNKLRIVVDRYSYGTQWRVLTVEIDKPVRVLGPNHLMLTRIWVRYSDHGHKITVYWYKEKEMDLDK